LLQFLSNISLPVSNYPKYDTEEYYIVMVEDSTHKDTCHVQVFNKVDGLTALLDISYVNRLLVEFMLAATLYVNSSDREIVNDGKYDKEVGLPHIPAGRRFTNT